MAFNFMDKDSRYSKYKIGRFTYGDPRVEDWWGHAGVTLEIGSFCSIAKGVVIWLGGNHHKEWVSTSPLNHFLGYDGGKSRHRFDQTGTNGSVIIGNDVWIGSGATIYSGVTIGDGAIIGGCAVVSKDVPPYSIAVGNPAKSDRLRFLPEQIQKLLKIQWWNWDDNKIKENIPLILNNNIDGFISKNY